MARHWHGSSRLMRYCHGKGSKGSHARYAPSSGSCETSGAQQVLRIVAEGLSRGYHYSLLFEKSVREGFRIEAIIWIWIFPQADGGPYGALYRRLAKRPQLFLGSS